MKNLNFRIWDVFWAHRVYFGLRPALKNWYECGCLDGEAIALCEALLDCCCKVEHAEGATKERHFGVDWWVSAYSQTIELSSGKQLMILTERCSVRVCLIANRHYEIQLGLQDA